jgi:hypothetical protein
MKYTCPCCGYKTLSENGVYSICSVCYWEDDPFQSEDPTHKSGANNEISLIVGQKNYIDFGACERGMKIYVRSPLKDEPKDENWKPVQNISN